MHSVLIGFSIDDTLFPATALTGVGREASRLPLFNVGDVERAWTAP
jgi:hypothetical protein